ncbi:MAG: hypothetical protein PUP91_16965 [Rhizonema sp. PD37]|nr:hypothetical protein [Rhizonema sp. PD37]
MVSRKFLAITITRLSSVICYTGTSQLVHATPLPSDSTITQASGNSVNNLDM